MNILIVTPGMKFGGAERVLSILANKWSEIGHNVSFLITVTNGVPSYTLHNDILINYVKYKNKKFRVINLFMTIRRFILKNKYDIVVSFMNDQCAITALALLGTGIPIVYSERNDPTKTNTRYIDKIYRKIVEKRATKVVFQTEGAQICYNRKVQNKSEVLLNPIEIEKFPVHDFKYEKDEIVAVGRLEKQKNFPLLIKAFSIIEKEFPTYTLNIYGEGSQREELKKLISKYKLNQKIFLKGEVSNIHNAIKDAKIFILTSDFEGLPNVLIEAMVIGLPCISTDCSPGGAKMLISNDYNGVLIPCNEVLILSQKIKELLLNREKAKILGKNALLIKEKVESTKIAKKWINLFNSAIYKE